MDGESNRACKIASTRGEPQASEEWRPLMYRMYRMYECRGRMDAQERPLVTFLRLLEEK